MDTQNNLDRVTLVRLASGLSDYCFKAGKVAGLNWSAHMLRAIAGEYFAFSENEVDDRIAQEIRTSAARLAHEADERKDDLELVYGKEERFTPEFLRRDQQGKVALLYPHKVLLQQAAEVLRSAIDTIDQFTKGDANQGWVAQTDCGYNREKAIEACINLINISEGESDGTSSDQSCK